METSEFIEEKITKKRGFWLSALLILMFITNPITAFIYFCHSEQVVQTYPKLTTGIVYLMGILCIVNVVLAVGMWMWKKWSVYGFYCITAIAFCINMYIGLGIMGSLMGLMGAIFIWVTTKKRWEFFS